MINSTDQLIAALPGQRRPHLKYNTLTSRIGFWFSLWTAPGNPGAGSAPGSSTGAICTNATAGAMAFNNPSNGALSYLAQIQSTSTSSTGTLVLYDRLWANSGFSGTSTAANTFTAPFLTRNNTGTEVELWLEVYTAIGSTTVTATATYTNQAGTSGKVATASLVGGAVQGQGTMFPFSLASGDSGVRTVSGVQLSGSTGTVGNYGLTLLRRIAELPIVTQNVANGLDFMALGMPQIPDNACLALMGLCNAASFGTQLGSIVIAQG